MKKYWITAGLTMAAMLASCSAKAIKINPNKEKYVVGICQYESHSALDEATKGFKDALSAGLTAEGRTVEFDYQDATSDVSICSTIVNGFVSKDVDLILANATPCLQMAYNATQVIPILGTSVTDYSSALNLRMDDGTSGTNVSGTSDLASISDQVNEMCRFLPTMKTVGILYCSNESNSKYQVTEATKYFTAKGVTVTKHSFSDTSDLASVCAAALNNDAVYIPTDNSAAKYSTTIKSYITDQGKPIFAGEAGIAKNCGFATLTIDYYSLGKVTGEMAVKVLLGKEDIRKMAIQFDPNPVKKYNKTICQQLSITPPADYVEL